MKKDEELENKCIRFERSFVHGSEAIVLIRPLNSIYEKSHLKKKIPGMYMNQTRTFNSTFCQKINIFQIFSSTLSWKFFISVFNIST